MPACSVFMCSNRTEKGFKLFTFPSNPEIKKIWINKVNCLGWKPSPKSRL